MKRFDLAVVGGGHAGVEAALIGARLGSRVALITMDLRALGRMSCNPAIGGLAKGQMVRELDVLGGFMARASDLTGIQFKVLNRSKGKSVWSPRAQIDKRRYEKLVRHSIYDEPGITPLEAEVVDIREEKNRLKGVVLRSGETVPCRTAVLTGGTFLNGLIHIGGRKVRAGRMGEEGSCGITEALKARGLVAGRLKTGTPPRLMGSTINWDRTAVISGDRYPVPFSYRSVDFVPPNLPCHSVQTTPACHAIIGRNLQRSPLFSGDIHGVGPRYCPSIEDKVHRFPERDQHLLFLEPEWTASHQIYCNGFSTSLPEEVQREALRTIPGLERVRFFRPGYAIEYDFFPPAQLKASLESKLIEGLFCAGQINGTSGYEEAAVQGLLAGINAHRYVRNQEPLTLGRDEGYIGVLVDDLITKDTLEPYRMFTARAEYRLLLRYSNADRRLAEKSYRYELLESRDYERLLKGLEYTDAILQALEESLPPDEINPLLIARGETPVSRSQPGREILKRPAISIQDLPPRLFHSLPQNGCPPSFMKEFFSEAETTVKYAGYIRRQRDQIEKLSRQEGTPIPPALDYGAIPSLSSEAREKLAFIRPETLGQAMRISGVSPADVAVLAVMLIRQTAPGRARGGGG